MSGESKLGYQFSPPPKWLRVDRRDGTLTERDFDLIAFLYESATTAELVERRGPSLSLDAIRRGIRWTAKDESLQRYLARLRDRGRYFDYIVTGNSRTRQVYVFRLYPDGPPDVSASCPPVQDGSCPPVDAAETSEPSRLPLTAADDVSARVVDADNGSCPPVASECPPVQVRTNPDVERVSADAASDACPPALDVREETNPSTKGRVEGEASSRGPARAHEDRKPPVSSDDDLDSLAPDVRAYVEKARMARTVADLATFPDGEERDFLTGLVETFDATLVEEA